MKFASATVSKANVSSIASKLRTVEHWIPKSVIRGKIPTPKVTILDYKKKMICLERLVCW